MNSYGIEKVKELIEKWRKCEMEIKKETKEVMLEALSEHKLDKDVIDLMTGRRGVLTIVDGLEIHFIPYRKDGNLSSRYERAWLDLLKNYKGVSEMTREDWESIPIRWDKNF